MDEIYDRAGLGTAQNARADAKILGVDTEKVYAATFGINAALCGIAGALIDQSLLHFILMYGTSLYS